jgi:hypothetical protein
MSQIYREIYKEIYRNKTYWKKRYRKLLVISGRVTYLHYVGSGGVGEWQGGRQVKWQGGKSKVAGWQK